MDKVNVSEVRFVKEFYPRLREDASTIKRYWAAIGKLPPIVVARGGVLVVSDKTHSSAHENTKCGAANAT